MVALRTLLFAAACACGADAVAQQSTPASPDRGPPSKDQPVAPTTVPNVGAPEAAPSAIPVVQPAPQIAVQFPAQRFIAQQPRFQFTIDPKSPVKELLPPGPATLQAPEPYSGTDLTRIPEVAFHAKTLRKAMPIGSDNPGVLVELIRDLLSIDASPSTAAAREIAHQIAKANHLNSSEVDGFMKALIAQRADLRGLPFAMGDACRTKGERSKQFTLAVNTVRRAMQQMQAPRAMQAPINAPVAFTTPSSNGVVTSATPPMPPVAVQFLAPQAVAVQSDRMRGDLFWERYEALIAEEDKAMAKADKAFCEHVTLGRIAALTQILAPEGADVRLGLVKFLSAIARAEATQALARMAVFSPEEEVRKASADALKTRRERDYNEILQSGLRHPWAPAAKHAAEALVRLERADMIPQLLAMLDDVDPRAPIQKEIEGKKVTVIREMVRVNHHQNCVLCHAPGNTDTVSADTLTASTPIPGEPLNSPLDGYNPGGSPDLLVRIDVTYLRQDFSAMLPVADAAPWPEMQRFDFLVRERVLSAEDAATYSKKLVPTEKGQIPPHRRAALAALRELTGKDTAPTAEAWRELLGMK